MEKRFVGKKLPRSLRHIFWSYNFSSIDTEKHKRTIIVNVINYGNWKHWTWIIKHYGKRRIKDIITEILASEFRESALKLIMLILGIKELKYATRSDYITSQNNIEISNTK